ncbi:MAG: site-specific DNA-methyltransferase [Clostridium sp.]|nr:site-specific DNA-methyltransferase [Clostridium sp.]
MPEFPQNNRLTRIILASTDKGDWILDPFCGSSTTGIAANLCGRRFAGIDQDEAFCRMSKARREEIESLNARADLARHITDLKSISAGTSFTCEDIPCGAIPF